MILCIKIQHSVMTDKRIVILSNKRCHFLGYVVSSKLWNFYPSYNITKNLYLSSRIKCISSKVNNLTEKDSSSRFLHAPPQAESSSSRFGKQGLSFRWLTRPRNLALCLATSTNESGTWRRRIGGNSTAPPPTTAMGGGAPDEKEAEQRRSWIKWWDGET